MIESKTTYFGIDHAWRAPWYRRLLARLFGKKILGEDMTCVVVGYIYKGKIYIEDIHNV